VSEREALGGLITGEVELFPAWRPRTGCRGGEHGQKDGDKEKSWGCASLCRTAG
jgi:hypothetical protein